MLALIAMLTTMVLAGAGAALPDPPEVDLASLPDSAVDRPESMSDDPHPVKAHLVTDRDQVRPGETFRAGIYLLQDDGWHTYWKSPGEIGLPTDIRWSLPEGARASDYAFAVPQRFELEVQQQEIVSYGYEGEILLFSDVTLPEGLPTGSFELGADVDWLVCEVNCIPGGTSLSTSIEVLDASAEPPEPTAFQALFDHFADHHPTPADQVPGVTFELATQNDAIRPGDTFELVIEATAEQGHLEAPEDGGIWPVFAPIISPDLILLDASLTPTEDGGLLAWFQAEALPIEELPEPTRLGGLFQLDIDGETVRTEVTRDVPWVDQGEPIAVTGSSLFDGVGGDVASGAASAQATPPPASTTLWTLPLMLGAAFLGGLILNVMPCVLPVLTLKLYSLVDQGTDPGERRTAGLAYTGGVLASFGALAALVLVLQATVGGIGWGFHFQYPGFVAAFGAVVFAFGLSLFGVFELPVLGAQKMSQASASKGGTAGHFLTGVFAAVLGTPCSAPFLGPAVGFAFAQPPAVVVLFFGVIGLGMAAPFLLVAYLPALFRLLPRPGPWMETFKQLMGFTLIATTVWLVGVLAGQLGTDAALGYLAFLAVVGLGAWIFGHYGGVAASGGRQAVAAVAAFLVIGVGAWGFLDLDEARADECDDGTAQVDGLAFDRTVPWQPFSEERVDALQGHPIFIDFTADWCLSCKVNERAVIDTAPVRDAMERQGIIPLKADWTSRDPVITAWLERFGRAGVPFYLVIPSDPSEDPIPLPEVITQDMLIEAFEKGARSGQADAR